MLRGVDPSTGAERYARPPLHDDAVATALAAADRTQRAWARRSLDDRAAVLRRAAALLEARADDAAARMADEMGKPLAEGRAEVGKCAWVCRHYAEHAAALLAPRPVASDGSRSYVRHDPLGVVLAVMPWNFPYWQVFRAAAPALMAGNAMLLKHAENVLDSGDAIAAVFADAGLPEGLFAHLPITHAQVSALIGDRRVAAVTVTGSERAGAAVASEAGRHLKKAVLELGGSDPFVVLSDADVAEAARVGATARLINGGQSCIAAKRFIVARAVAADFEAAFLARLREAVVGSPRDPATTVGPMARADLREDLHAQVARSVAAGARCVLGGAVPEGPGCYYPVTLLTGVGPGMPAWDDEVFGPVAALQVVDDDDAAIAAANDTRYGLGASVWTDPSRADAIAPQIAAGCVFFNGLVKSDPRLPFGGVKRSGYGRELGDLGIREFTNAKTVWVL